VEDTLAPHVVEAASRPAHIHPQVEGHTIEGMVGSVPALLEGVLPEPAVDMAPVVVETPTAEPEEEVDEWTQSVRSGQRRLV